MSTTFDAEFFSEKKNDFFFPNQFSEFISNDEAFWSPEFLLSTVAQISYIILGLPCWSMGVSKFSSKSLGGGRVTVEEPFLVLTIPSLLRGKGVHFN